MNQRKRLAPTACLRLAPRMVLGCILLSLLAACGGGGHSPHYASRHYGPTRYYPPPGPAGDPWGPYIHEASGRFGVPEQWVRAVMHQESGGQEDVISWAGAVGLMQVMPQTYDELRDRYGLGDDPFDPHNNILAGTAYLREMYERYGAPGFLAAYNAGPNRVDRYLTGGEALPEETVSYVASIAPRLGGGTPMSGPLSVYAGNGYATRLATARTSTGCDPDAAYNPDVPCAPLRPATVQPAVLQTAAASVSGYCDPDAAFDPSHPCQPAPVIADTAPAVSAPAPTPSFCDPDAAYDPSQPCQPRSVIAAEPPAPRSATSRAVAMTQPAAEPPPYYPVVTRPLPDRSTVYASRSEARPIQERMAQRIVFRPGPSSGQWGIQVGAYGTLAAAQAAANHARALAPRALGLAKIVLPATTPLGNRTAFRARLTGLSQSEAATACARLSSRSLPCMTLPPAPL